MRHMINCSRCLKGGNSFKKQHVTDPGKPVAGIAKRKNYPVTCILLGMAFGSGVVFDYKRRESVRNTICKLQNKYKNEGLRWTCRTSADKESIHVFRIG